MTIAEKSALPILLSQAGRVATITFNRPEVYNAHDEEALDLLLQSLHNLTRDDSVGVVVITGAGEKAFCTGGDVGDYATRYAAHPSRFWAYLRLLQECVDLLMELPKPTIARVNGRVAGGGNAFHLACDFAIAAEHAIFQQVGTRIGSVAAVGPTQWWPLVVGDRHAREILMLCEPFTASQALEWGLVNHVAPYAQIDRVVAEWADRLLAKMPEAIRYTKQQLNALKRLTWSMGAGHGRDWLTLHVGSAESMEGLNAFREKRAPDWGRLQEMAGSGVSSAQPWGPALRKCPRCGCQDLPLGHAFCGKCGAPFDTTGSDGKRS